MNDLSQGYEHLDVIWGKNVDKDVIPQVLKTLSRYCDGSEAIKNHAQSSTAREEEEEVTTTISSSE